MNKEELALMLSGSRYPLHIFNKLLGEAKKSGLVIIYGESDDLMEFRGAINEEIGAYEGVNVSVSKNGITQDWNSFIECEPVEDECRNYFLKKSQSRPIKAIWGEGEYSWTYKTEIPHSCFDVIRDGEKYCRGIVFHVDDIFQPVMNEQQITAIDGLEERISSLQKARQHFLNISSSEELSREVSTAIDELIFNLTAAIEWVKRQTG